MDMPGAWILCKNGSIRYDMHMLSILKYMDTSELIGEK